MKLYIERDITIYGLEINTLRDIIVETNVKDIRLVKIDDTLFNIKVLYLKNDPEYGFNTLIDINKYL